jgi:DNA-binding transcriptional LysR family regulator
MAALGVRVRVALAAARGGWGTASSTHSLIAALHRARLVAGRVAEIRLDCGVCASEPAGHLGDSEALLVAVAAGERYRPTALLKAVQTHRASNGTDDRGETRRVVDLWRRLDRFTLHRRESTGASRDELGNDTVVRRRAYYDRGIAELDLVKVRSFVAVAEHLHFRLAAEQLHLAQPAVSRHIQALEQQLGVRLLERDRRSVRLTDAGSQLLEDAIPLLAAADAARRRVQRAARGVRSLVIGFRTGIIPTAAVRTFAHEHPEVAVHVQRLEWDDQEEAVLGGRVDVAYVRRPISGRGLRLVSLYNERRLVALPRDHPLARRRSLRQSEIADEHHLRYLEPVAAGTERATILRSVEEKLEYVATGQGIIVLPLSATKHYRRPDVVYVRVTDAEPDEVLLACEASRRSRLISAFIRAARAAAAADPDVVVTDDGHAAPHARELIVRG